MILLWRKSKMISKKDVSLVVKSENEKNLQKAREKIDAEIKKTI